MDNRIFYRRRDRQHPQKLGNTLPGPHTSPVPWSAISYMVTGVSQQLFKWNHILDTPATFTSPTRRIFRCHPFTSSKTSAPCLSFSPCLFTLIFPATYCSQGHLVDISGLLPLIYSYVRVWCSTLYRFGKTFVTCRAPVLEQARSYTHASRWIVEAC